MEKKGCFFCILFSTARKKRTAKKTTFFHPLFQKRKKRGVTKNGKKRFAESSFSLWKTLWKVWKTLILLGCPLPLGCGKQVANFGRLRGREIRFFLSLEKCKFQKVKKWRFFLFGVFEIDKNLIKAAPVDIARAL